MERVFNLMKKSDEKLYYLMNVKIRNKITDMIMRIITGLFDPLSASVIGLLIYLYSDRTGITLGRTILLIAGITQVIVYAVKKKAGRVRPFVALHFSKFTLTPPKDIYSFPSGHTSIAFSYAISLGLFIPALAPALMGLAFLAGFSRIYLGFHYPTDVIIGAIIPFIVTKSLLLMNFL